MQYTLNMLNYLYWHYSEFLPKVSIIWRNLTVFPIYYFSIGVHLKTLLSPWKRQLISAKPGFNIGNLLEVVITNMTSRIIGFIMRTTTIIFGLTLLPFLFCAGMIIFALCLLPLTSLPFYATRKVSLKNKLPQYLNSGNKNLRELANFLLQSDYGKFICLRVNIPYDVVVNILTKSADEGNWHEYHEIIAKKKKLSITDHLMAVVYTYHPLKSLFLKYQIKPDDLFAAGIWYEKIESITPPAPILDLDSMKSIAGIGSDWAYGYTYEFDKYAQDLTHTHLPFPLLLGREKEISEMEKILVKTQDNNILIVGDPGVARHILVTTLAHRIASGVCLPGLAHKRILAVNMHALISAQPTLAQVKGLASDIIEEAKSAGNTIIFIDEIDMYVSTGVSRMDLSDIIEKLAQSSVGIIGITTSHNFHKYIEPNEQLTHYFEKIEVTPPPVGTVLTELELSVVPVLEKKYKIVITIAGLKKVIEDAGRYLTQTPFPGKAIELLDQTAVFVTTSTKSRLLLPSHVDSVIEEKLHIPTGDLNSSEKQKLANLEDHLHRTVINQNEAITAVAGSLRRARMQISPRNKTIGSFLFLGPTGVGKTETAKALALSYFGSKDNLIRFDMSQFKGPEGMARLIGSLSFGTSGELTGKLADNPFSLILFDEFEKADQDLINIFLTLFDEGYLTNALGKRIDARQAIFIATSNAGSEYIRETVQTGKGGNQLQKETIEYILRQNIFSPELLNRFDAVVVFKPLTEGNLKEVARLMLNDLNDRLKPKEIAVKITPQLLNSLVSAGLDRQFGGRAMKRMIAEKVEDQIAILLLQEPKLKNKEIEINF